MDDDFSVVTDQDIKNQKQKLKGKNKHNTICYKNNTKNSCPWANGS